MELFRALAVFAEPPEGPEVARLAALLNLGEPPSASEYTETFVFRLYPYASVYLGAEGMLGGEARARVAGFLAALGETPPPEPDHLSTLLATYARLSAAHESEDAGGDERGAEADERRAEANGRGAEADESGARRRAGLSAARKAFLWEHLLSWLPVYLGRVAEVAPPFYRRWAELLLSALVEEARACGRPRSLPLHLREAPPPADPRAESAEEFLSSLLAPARSGLVITRDDLARAARALGTSARAGERRFVLKSLMGQDACGVLAWLSEEASRQSARHAARRDAFGPVAEWWAARTSATEKLLRELKADAEFRRQEQEADGRG
ncbi:MAG: molecular chaperone TorD family protein [Acidobacteriota bacterium]|nr:molecular chaperone TorD family protein [Acidobacteriota bacterium]